jgi:hypothetical protein
MGLYFIEGMPVAGHDRPEPGTAEPEKWQPYKVWSGDLYECKGCGAQIISGVGLKSVAERHHSNFNETIEKTGASQCQIIIGARRACAVIAAMTSRKTISSWRRSSRSNTVFDHDVDVASDAFGADAVTRAALAADHHEPFVAFKRPALCGGEMTHQKLAGA